MRDTETELLERDAELTALDCRLAWATDRRGGVVVGTGEAGIGKTRLLAAAAGIARDRGYRVLAARGGELERELAFGVVRQLFAAQPVPAGATSTRCSSCRRRRPR